MTADAASGAGEVIQTAPEAAPEAVSAVVQFRDVLLSEDVTLRKVTLSESGAVRLEYVPQAPAGTEAADDEVAYIIGVYSEIAAATGALGTLKATGGVVEWVVERAWIEAWARDELDTDGLLERVADSLKMQEAK